MERARARREGVLVADLPEEGKDRAERELPPLVADLAGNAGLPVVWLRRGGRDRAHAGRTRRESRGEARDVAARRPRTSSGGCARGGAKQPGVIVVGAHFDHLGLGGPASLAPGAKEPHNGADDNASGVAGLLEIARTLAARRSELERDVVFVAFSGEELGDLGSSTFTKSPPGGLAMKDVVAMLNIDMVGRLREKLQVLGGETAKEWSALVPPPVPGERSPAS